VVEVTFAPDGSAAFAANGGSGSVSAIDPSTHEVVATIAVGDGPVGAWRSETRRTASSTARRHDTAVRRHEANIVSGCCDPKPGRRGWWLGALALAFVVALLLGLLGCGSSTIRLADLAPRPVVDRAPSILGQMAGLAHGSSFTPLTVKSGSASVTTAIEDMYVQIADRLFESAMASRVHASIEANRWR
jgi:YVTN family beta-propeller protein